MAANEKVIVGLMNLSRVNRVVERRKRLLALSKRWGRDAIKPSHSELQRRLNAQIKTLEQSRVNASRLSNSQLKKLGLRAWITSGKKAEHQLQTALAMISMVVERGGY